MRNRHPSGPTLYASSILALTWSVGCGSSDNSKSGAGESQLVEWDFWTGTGPDAQASKPLQYVLDTYSAQNPQVRVVSGVVAHLGGGQDYATTLEQVLAGPNLHPDVDVMTLNNYFEMRDFLALDVLLPLNTVYDTTNMAAGSVASTAVTENGSTYGAPIDLSRDNVVFYNKHLMDAAQVDISTLTSPTATLDDLFAAAKQVQTYLVANNLPGAVFSLPQAASDVTSSDPSSKYPWTVKDLFFDFILPATVGRPSLISLLTPGQVHSADWDSAGVRQALLYEKTYIDYANQDFLADCVGKTTLECATVAPWDALTSASPTGAMACLGTWYAGNFRQANLVYGQDWGTFVVPGQQGFFLGHMDFFLVAKYGPNQANAKKFIQLITDPTVQTNFNQLFGAIPARIDADLSDASKFDEFDRSTQADLKELGFTDRTENITASAWAKAMVGPIGKFVTAARGVTDQTIVNAAVDSAVADLKALCISSQVCVD